MTLVILIVVIAVVILSSAATLVGTTVRRRRRGRPVGPGSGGAQAVVAPGTAPPRPTGRRPPATGPPSTRPPARPATGRPAAARPATGPATAVPPVAGDGTDAGSGAGDVAGLLDEGALEEALAELDAELSGELSDAGADGVDLLERPRFRDRLGKARGLFSGYLGGIRGRDRIDAQSWDDLEEALILADVGMEVTSRILDDLRGRVKRGGITTGDGLVDALKADMVELLAGDRTLHLEEGATTVWLFVGVNGVGKTTTIGKLGMRQRAAGHSVVMAAGDTFRAAAADQLAMWAGRVGAEVVRGNEGGDPGAVIFDAVEHARARHADLVLADTAGRLHTKVNLMEELKKVRRVASRGATVAEVLLVVDATTGQNGLVQARQFSEAVEVTGVVLTKLDGTAKGGIALAISAELGLPIKLVGLGEAASDLVEFDPEEFVDALVGADEV